MKKIAYFDCFSGIAGDMVLGALIDAGLDIKFLAKELKKLKIKGYELKKSKVRRGGLIGTKFTVVVKDSPSAHTHRPLGEILKIIDESSLSHNVKDVAKNIFNNIGGVEAKIHGISDKKDLSLHELGDVDSIVDIVGTAIALDKMEIEEIYSSPVHFGRTLVSTRHGVLPTPAPASLELLKGVPAKISNIDAELVTPTGAGILKTLVKNFGEMPQMKVSHIGHGAGTQELSELPNMLRIMIGERHAAFKKDRIFVIETNIDDMNPQHFNYLFEKLFKEGALDAYTTSIQMKKTRPAFKLTVLSAPSIFDKLCSIIFKETSSIGLRYHEQNRYKLDREIVKVDTGYGRVRVKLSRGPDDILTVSPEYEDCAKLARLKKVPLKTVCDAAKRAVEV
ncbi:MAG: nickel pincer cofactor biosynthesis protein LarC [Candidatus Omnitrophota bacterium]|nr:nickel pincer cofactor biosynthesis protein LarC [Candidatus Omnitrophota bacterium]